MDEVPEELKNSHGRIPNGYWRENLNPPELADGTVKIPDRPESLFFQGPNGSGKTLNAVVALRKWWWEIPQFERVEGRDYRLPPLTPEFWTVMELLREIRKTYQEGAKRTEDEVIVRFKRLPILLLDDLGAEKTTDFNLSSMYEILDHRTSYGKTTLVTSNLPLKEIHAVEPRIASRLAGMRLIRPGDKDWRIEGKRGTGGA